MPVSCTVDRKKTKNKTQIICESMQNVIEQAKKQVTVFSELKKSLDYEPGLFRQAVEKGVTSKEDVKSVLTEQKNWKIGIKADIKADIMAEKRRLKAERKAKRQSGSPVTERRAPQKRRRKTGRLI